jgi:cytochrome P450
VEESLRVRPPLHAHQKFLADDFTTSDGTVIPAGGHVIVPIGAANTDDRVFPDPERIALQRENTSRHVTFGGGLQHCLGAPLARVQLQETVAELTRRFERIDIEGGPVPRHPSLIFPSLSALPVNAVPAPLGSQHP